MTLIFRPWVRFVAQDANSLCLIVRRSEKYFKIPSAQFNYQILVEGVAESEISAPVITFLKENHLVEPCALINPGEFKKSFLHEITDSYDDLMMAQKRIADTHCGVLDLAGIGPDGFSEISQSLSVQYFCDLSTCEKALATSPDEYLTIVVTNSYFKDELVQLNKVMIRNRKRWVLVLCNQTGINIGPYFDNAPTDFCFNCFQQRIASWEEQDVQKVYRKKNNFSSQDLAKKIEISWLQFQLVRYVGTGFAYLKCYIQHFDILDGQLLSLPFLPYPLCLVCKP